MKYLTLLSVLALSACSSVQQLPALGEGTTANMNLIALSEQSAPQGVSGTFKFYIKTAGSQYGDVFLNTENDYRDRRAITISIDSKVAAKLTEKYGQSAETFFIDKTIEVTGEAKRVTIDFLSKGRKTNKYYYQTHVDVNSVDQIRIVP
ncbi:MULTISPECIES: hypothetical protein [unclassified Pseudoalteromonas]|uniref:hypothetical protein n=1 Tax=unclassified Pseudoalteromonas TaxID=194690 RepID=UPI0018CD3589|nr:MULTISPECIES: hypothetical protein [unclassified Pseudoalteromonas]MBH0027394.1 hypothetical protein [Pseudoalteromonas sp. SWN29]MBH0039583.1 hypothetical protein [Pseudoalteromonas sp. SWN166]